MAVYLVDCILISIVVFLASLAIFGLFWTRSSTRFGASRSQYEMPSDYSFVSSTAVRALETTNLAYIAPAHPDVRQAMPVVFRVFDRPRAISVQW